MFLKMLHVSETIQIAEEVDSDPRAAYFRQMEYG